MKPTVYTQPFGVIEPDILNAITDGLERCFDFDTGLFSPIDIPKYAYSERRRQYSAPTIIRRLSRTSIGPGDKILGVINEDLYVKGRNYIFGQAQVSGRASIISLFRLKDPVSWLFIERVVKEAIHELGHTLGFEHCPHEDCVMHFSHTVADTDIKNSSFCAYHQKQLMNKQHGQDTLF